MNEIDILIQQLSTLSPTVQESKLLELNNKINFIISQEKTNDQNLKTFLSNFYNLSPNSKLILYHILKSNKFSLPSFLALLELINHLHLNNSYLQDIFNHFMHNLIISEISILTFKYVNLLSYFRAYQYGNKKQVIYLIYNFNHDPYSIYRNAKIDIKNLNSYYYFLHFLIYIEDDIKMIRKIIECCYYPFLKNKELGKWEEGKNILDYFPLKKAVKTYLNSTDTLYRDILMLYAEISQNEEIKEESEKKKRKIEEIEKIIEIDFNDFNSNFKDANDANDDNEAIGSSSKVKKINEINSFLTVEEVSKPVQNDLKKIEEIKNFNNLLTNEETFNLIVSSPVETYPQIFSKISCNSHFSIFIKKILEHFLSLNYFHPDIFHNFIFYYLNLDYLSEFLNYANAHSFQRLNLSLLVKMQNHFLHKKIKINLMMVKIYQYFRSVKYFNQEIFVHFLLKNVTFETFEEFVLYLREIDKLDIDILHDVITKMNLNEVNIAIRILINHKIRLAAELIAILQNVYLTSDDEQLQRDKIFKILAGFKCLPKVKR